MTDRLRGTARYRNQVGTAGSARYRVARAEIGEVPDRCDIPRVMIRSWLVPMGLHGPKHELYHRSALYSIVGT